MRNALYLAGSVLLALQWIVARAAHLTPASPPLEAAAAGAAIFGSAFLLSWAAEAAEKDIPPALAIAFLAIVAVLPEYAVDMYFAWEAPHREGYTAFATANMTGGNRLLIGLGWPTVVAAAWLRQRKRAFDLARSQSVEVLFLLIATLYSFVIPWKQTISLWDAAILVSLFVVYMILAGRAEHAEPDLHGPALWIGSMSPGKRRAVVVCLFLYSAAAILLAAEPFAEGLVASGRQLGIEEFLLVQWIAPLASESPEFIVCILFAWQGKASSGISALISSAVNQWTLLVGMLPIVYSASASAPLAMPLDARQIEEMLLTTAQSLYAVTIIADLRFSVREAAVLLGLFACQFLFTDATARYALSGVYLAMTAAALVVGGPGKRRSFAELPAVVFGRVS